MKQNTTSNPKLLTIHEQGAFPERLRIVIDGKSVRSFARACGMSDSVLRQYLTGKSEPTRPVLLAIACCTGVRVDWLAAGSGPMRPGEDAYCITRWYTESGVYPASADEGREETEGPHALADDFMFKADWVNKELGVDPAALVMSVARGNAMEPTIQDGDFLLVNNRQCKIDKDGLYLLRVNNALVTRRIQVMLDGGLNITCDNPAYTPQAVSGEAVSSLDVVGRLVWVGKKIA